MADVFVSYAREDRARVAPFVDLLIAQGWSVWWDRELIPGNTFENVIDDEITGARCVVVFWSEHSTQSEWVLAEANDGLEREILIPVMLDEVRVPLVFRRKQAAFLIGWPEQRDGSELQRVIDAIGEVINRPSTPVNIQGITSRWSWRSFLPVAIGVAILLVVGLGVLQFKQPGSVPESKAPNLSITVLPFSANDSLAGISFEVADRLREVEDIYVTSRARTLEFVENEGRLKLDTRYLLKGELSAGAFSISLLDGEEILWQEQVGIAGDDLSAAADQIANKVAASFNKRLPPRTQQIAQKVYLQYLTAKATLRKPPSDQSRNEAQQLLQNVVENSPRFAEARAALCEAYILGFRETKSSELFEQAEKHCHRAQTLSDGNSYVHVVMGRLYTAAGEQDLALEHLDKAMQIAPFSTDAMRAIAQSHKTRQEYQAAEDILMTAISIEPNYWANYQALAGVYFNRGDYRQAAEYFDRQTDLVLNKGPAYADKGAALFLLEDFDLAIEAWELSLEQETNVIALSNLGSAYLFNGQFDRAADSYTKALEIRPENDRFWSNLGESLMFAEEPHKEYFAKAITLAEERLAINPDDIEAISGLSIYHATLGNRPEALKYSEKALQLAGKDVYTVYDLAVARARLGDKDETAALLLKLIGMGYSRTLVNRDANFNQFPLEEML